MDEQIIHIIIAPGAYRMIRVPSDGMNRPGADDFAFLSVTTTHEQVGFLTKNNERIITCSSKHNRAASERLCL